MTKRGLIDLLEVDLTADTDEVFIHVDGKDKPIASVWTFPKPDGEGRRVVIGAKKDEE